MKKRLSLLFVFCSLVFSQALAFSPDNNYLTDRQALDTLQHDTFLYMWEHAHPESGMAYETSSGWVAGNLTVGGTGFGIAAIVVAVDRGWVTREQAVTRLLKITHFLRDKTPRKALHGAFPHWLNGEGSAVPFGHKDIGADIVETSFLIQGLLIARAYFNGPGAEENLRSIITQIWEDVDWDWFTAGLNNGIHWHWSLEKNFDMGIRILGYNECLVTYILALASPSHPISRKAYDYWTSGKGYQPKTAYGYAIEASLPSQGPLFLVHYSFIGLDPRRMADSFVPNGYFVRNIKQALSNRGYCIQNAPARNKYSANVWGLTASYIKNGYAANEPAKDSGTIAPTAALSSMPYTPHYSMQFLQYINTDLREKIWGKFGPYDAFSLRDNWFSDSYLAISQLPIVCMVENYRSGLLWELFMSDTDVRRGLRLAGIHEPNLGTGFPEAVVTLKRQGNGYAPDAYEIRRHPDTDLYAVPYWCDEAEEVFFTLTNTEDVMLFSQKNYASKGRNSLRFPQFSIPLTGELLTLTMQAGGKAYTLPLRLY